MALRLPLGPKVNKRSPWQRREYGAIPVFCLQSGVESDSVSNSTQDVQELSDLTVLSSTKDVVSLASLWTAQPAVMVFLRHFG